MNIGELAKRTGMTTHSIRFYEKQGLLEGTQIKRGENNYRYYSDATAKRLFLIKQGQAGGFTLAEIRSLITTWQSGQMSLNEKVMIIQQKIMDIEMKIHDLEQMRDCLHHKLHLIEAGNI